MHFLNENLLLVIKKLIFICSVCWQFVSKTIVPIASFWRLVDHSSSGQLENVMFAQFGTLFVKFFNL